MKKKAHSILMRGGLCLAAFVLWTLLILLIDVQPVGPMGTSVGFSSLNTWFHSLTGVHMALYTITDWLSLVPLFVCMFFGCLGLVQWIKRKNLLRVDQDILLLGFYYAIVILSFLAFEIYPFNYRPVLIEGILEASYPSSTTLLVLSVMPTLAFQLDRRMQCKCTKAVLKHMISIFSIFMVTARMISGVHWFTDIIGSVLLCTGLFHLYQAAVLLQNNKNN